MSVAPALKERLEFIGLGAEGRALLNELLPVIRRELPPILDQFYAGIAARPGLARFFGGNATAMKQASKAQETHWVKLFSGSFDDGYFDSVRAIGRTHSRIGLDPQWYVGGYAFILRHLIERIEAGSRRFALGQRKRASAIAALTQATMLDMELSISVYLEENEAKFAARLETLADDFQTKVGSVTEQLAAASTQLEATAQSMSRSSDNASDRAAAVAAAAEQVSAGIQTASSATQQLSASVATIREQVGQSSRVASRAVEDAARTADIVAALSEAADRIDTVIGLIAQIAGKTNMLALNASIEAARAGEAGKAFDVVAVEVKHLADQTSRATEDIERQIRAIQTTTGEAVAAIRAISGTIREVAEISVGITAAIEEQASAAIEISHNVQQTAQAAQQVSTNIIGVSQATENNVVSAREVFASASGLTHQATALNSEVSAFIDNVRAA